MAEDKKYENYPLGTKGRPFPMMTPATSVETDLGVQFLPPTLGVLEDPLVISTRRSYAEMMGIAYREMPSPSMLRVFYDGLALRSPDSERKIHFVLGAPGVGKSFFAKQMGKMRDERGAIVVDCGNRNMDELVFETILDTEKGKSLYQKIEEKAMEGTLNPASLKLLEENLGRGFSREGDKIAFDWDAVGRPMNQKDVDGNLIEEKETDKERLAKATKALMQVCELEGMAGEGDGIGLKTRPGPIIKAWEEGREIVLDEYNKHKKGTDSGLQTLWQVMNGEVKEHIQSGGAGLSYTFRRKDMKPGFFVTLTGNGTEDGEATQELSESAYSRLQPDFIPPLEKMDWQHRICQIMTDVPISTLYKCSENQWRKNPKEFGKLVGSIQTLGRSEKEFANIPELQKTMVKNWQGVLTASEKLADFYNEWAKLVDPENPKLPSELSMEVDEGYKIQVGVGMRMMIKHLNKAAKGSPDVTSAQNASGFELDDWSQPPKTTVKNEAVGAKYGTNLSRVILEEIDKTTRGRGKHNLHGVLMDLAAKHGIIEASFAEAKKSKTSKTLPELLDLDRQNDNVKVTEETLETQNILCDYLREGYPDLSKNNDDIVSAVEVETGINALLEQKELSEKTPRDRFLIVPNPMFMESKSGDAEPFMMVPVIDTAKTKEEIEGDKEYQKRISSNDELLGHETFLKTLSMPKIGRSNMNSLWNKAIEEVVGVGSEDADFVAIAQKESNSGLSVVSLVCREEKTNEQITMNVLLKEKAGERLALITSDGSVSKKTLELLEKQGVTYVELNKQDSLQKINKSLTRILGENVDPEIKENLVAAHQLRNKNVAEGADVSEALTTTKPSTPVLLLKAKKER